MCVAAVSFGQPYAPTPAHQVKEAYFQGRIVPFEAEPDSLLSRSFVIGSWHFGRRLRDKPRDGRLNLYITSPGSQYPVEGSSPFGFNCLLNALPKTRGEAKYDVYWAVVLDPAFKKEIHSERDLLLATQAEFEPKKDYTVQGAPGYELLRRYVRVANLKDLKPYRRKSGALPRVIIVPARIVLKASAGDSAPSQLSNGKANERSPANRSQ